MDIQRTVLWVVFSMSLLFLWDKWQSHNGNQSMFFPNPAQMAKSAAGSAPGAAKSDVPQSSASVVASAGTVAAAAVTPDASATPVKGETITITTDVLKADI